MASILSAICVEASSRLASADWKSLLENEKGG